MQLDDGNREVVDVPRKTFRFAWMQEKAHTVCISRVVTNQSMELQLRGIIFHCLYHVLLIIV